EFEKCRLRWMWGRATFTMVASSTTMSWAVRMTARTTEGWRRHPPGVCWTLRTETIDWGLSAGILKGEKRKLPPLSIWRVPPFGKPNSVRGDTAMSGQLETSVDEERAGRPMRSDARRNYDHLVVA